MSTAPQRWIGTLFHLPVELHFLKPLKINSPKTSLSKSSKVPAYPFILGFSISHSLTGRCSRLAFKGGNHKNMTPLSEHLDNINRTVSIDRFYRLLSIVDLRDEGHRSWCDLDWIHSKYASALKHQLLIDFDNFRSESEEGNYANTTLMSRSRKSKTAKDYFWGEASAISQTAR